MTDEATEKQVEHIRRQGVASVGKRTHLVPRTMSIMENPALPQVAVCGTIIHGTETGVDELPYCAECLDNEVEYARAVSDAFLQRALALHGVLVDVSG